MEEDEEEKRVGKQTKRKTQKVPGTDELQREALEILRALGETMIFNYQLFCSQF